MGTDDVSKPKPKPETELYCSFCGKSQEVVKKLLAGPSSFICDACVVLSVEVLSLNLKEAANSEGVVTLSPQADEPHRIISVRPGVTLVVTQEGANCDFLKTLAHRMSPLNYPLG